MASQFGQGEYIYDLLNASGINHGQVFEAGAASPSHVNNSEIFRKNGWTNFLVEPSHLACNEWKALKLSNVSVHNKYISYAETGLEDILHECGCGKELDVLFFDIDGGEYQLFRGLISFRPKIVCIEYDNSFPLSINYVPRMIRHHQNGGQASSTSMFHLFRQKRYTYLRSFFQDHIFISDEYLDSIGNLSNLGINTFGRKAFINNASDHLYSYKAVLINQPDNHAKDGVKFYSTKIEALLDNGYISEACHFFWILRNVMKDNIPNAEQRGESYHDLYVHAVDEFVKEYSHILFYHS